MDDSNNSRMKKIAETPARTYTNGLEWCKDYMAMTVALNEYIGQGEFEQADNLLETRQGMLNQLPDMVKLETANKNTEPFVKMLEEIRTLEGKGKSMLTDQLDELSKETGNLNRYRRSITDTLQTAPLSRFIDTKS